MRAAACADMTAPPSEENETMTADTSPAGLKSGAGKTEASKHVMRYLLARSSSGGGGDGGGAAGDAAAAAASVDALLLANVALESFGNAKVKPRDDDAGARGCRLSSNARALRRRQDCARRRGRITRDRLGKQHSS